MKKKLFLVFLAVAAAICLALGLSACGKSNNGTYYLFVNDEYVKSEYVIIDGKEWSNSDGMGGKLKIKDGKAYFYMDFFGEEVVWQQGEIGDGKLVLQGLSGTMTYYKEGKAHIHSYGDWHVTTQPTCTAAGEKTRICSCGEKEILTIPALGHATSGDGITYILPTCQSKGSIKGICGRCGNNVDEEIPVKPENHYIDEGKDTTVCSGCGTKLATSMALEISSNGKYAILKEAEGTAVIVPAVYHGIPVTSIDYEAFWYCTALESVTIGNGVTEIGGSAFEGCASLESINIPDSVTSIGDEAFSSCTSLTSVTIGNGVTEIGSSAFSGCTSLESIEIGADNKNYSSQGGILYNKEKTEIVEVPKAIKGAVTIPDSVTEIYWHAFSGCTSLESITIPDSVTEIYWHAFSGCTALESITIPDSVTSIDYEAFYRCTALSSVTIGNGVTEIGGDAFEGCVALERVNITSIKSWCSIDFYDYDSNPLYYAHNLYLDGELVKNLEIPEDVTSIDAWAFHYCTSLESVTIGNGVTEIGNYAFYKCTSLTSVTIPDSVTSIGDWAFDDCTALESIEVGAENQNYSSQDGILYNKEKTKLICVPGGKSAVSIPNSVTTIGGHAFYKCTSLTSITIPDSVTEIGWGAFEGCTSLASVTIGNGVTSIVWDAFSGCTSLESVTFKNTAGWKAGNTTVDVTNPVNNARYLKDFYCSYTWRREG